MKKVYLIIALILCLSAVATLVILNGKKNADDFDGNKDVSVSDDMTENDPKTETPDETKENAGTEKSDLKDPSSYDSPNKIYTIDEIEEMIAEKEEKANVTSVIKSGKDAVWYKIEIQE